MLRKLMGSFLLNDRNVGMAYTSSLVNLSCSPIRPFGLRGVALLLVAASALGAGAARVSAGDAPGEWRGWRGDGSGVSTEDAAPLYWDSENGVAWRSRIAGEGNSSPIVWRDRVFLTASAEEGLTRLIICLDATTGETLWRTKVDGEQTSTYPRSGRASPTPVTDGQRVYAFFDSPGLVAVDFDGQVKWVKNLGPFNSAYNMAGSPVVCGDLVVVSCDHSGPSFIVAFDRVTGAERWRTKRDGGMHYATPLVLTHDGRKQIVVNAQTIVSYDAATGERLWWCRGMKHATTPTPVYHDGLVYATCGRNGPSLAIDPGGRGDVTDTHVRMHLSSGGPYVPSPLIVDGLLAIPGDNGRLRFADLNGEVVLTYLVPAKIRKFTASPVLCAGKIYWPDESGRTHVLTVSGLRGEKPMVEEVASNPLDETCLASPAVAGGCLYIRTAKNLYCIVGGEAKYALPPPVDLPDDFAALEALYDAQPKGEFDDTDLRIAMVVKAATFDSDEAIQLLAQAAHQDKHWDVCEEAIRALGRYGDRATPALLTMFVGGQPFLKTVAAEHLARIKPAAAAQTLIDAARSEQTQVRIGCIKALGRIAAAHEDVAGAIAAALVELTADGEGVVRRAAISALAAAADQLGTYRSAAVAAVQGRVDDANTLVAQAAKKALQGPLRDR